MHQVHEIMAFRMTSTQNKEKLSIVLKKTSCVLQTVPYRIVFHFSLGGQSLIF